MRQNNQSFRIAILSLAAFFMLGAVGYCFTDTARVHPKHSVTLLKNDKAAGEFTQEFPLPNGEMLKANGPCVVKLQDVTLGVTDQTIFSVDNSDGLTLYVAEGTVYFGLAKLPKDMTFVTANHNVPVEQMLLNASAGGGILNGVLNVSGDVCQIGVIDGGSLRVGTLSGSKLIKTDQLLEFSPQANPNPILGSLAKIGSALGAKGSGAAIIGGAAVAAGAGAVTAGGVAWENHNDNGGSGKDASPSAPGN